ncbi:MAG: treZ [Sphingomonas bacterium]|nr:treZ [Sphingomonas bacterium]
MTRFARDLPMGATLTDQGTRFRFWAPAQQAVTLEIDGGASVPMRQLADGWFEAEAPCGAGTRYRYRLSPELAVPDPASRAIAGDVHDWSLVVDPGSYAWRNAGWSGRRWHETVLYELHAGLLDGFEGVAARLPELAELGVTAIELMPIAEFPGNRNWGYDGVLPFAPAAAYGTPDQLKAMIDRAHDLGLMVFLDVVYNHFGPDGNYLPVYAPHFFDEARHTPWGGAIDFGKAPVRQFFVENALYWLEEYRFDGLRFDAVHAIDDNDFLDALAAEIRRAVAPERQIHLVLENESNDAERLSRDYDAQWNDDFHNVLHVLLTGETGAYYQDFADRPAKRLARCLAEGFIYQGEGSPNHDGKPRGRPSGHLPPTAFVSFLQNHDQVGNRALGERLTLLARPQALHAATALMLLCPQIPMIFMGEEVGSETPFLFFTDFHHELADAVREGRRREFAKFPAFADPAQREKIPDPNAVETFATSRPRGSQADTWRARYRDLIALRQARIVPTLPGASALGAEAIGDQAVRARWRLGNGAVLTLAINLGETAVPDTDLPSAAPIHAVGTVGAAKLGGYSFGAWLEAAA